MFLPVRNIWKLEVTPFGAMQDLAIINKLIISSFVVGSWLGFSQIFKRMHSIVDGTALSVMDSIPATISFQKILINLYFCQLCKKSALSPQPFLQNGLSYGCILYSLKGAQYRCVKIICSNCEGWLHHARKKEWLETKEAKRWKK